MTTDPKPTDLPNDVVVETTTTLGDETFKVRLDTRNRVFVYAFGDWRLCGFDYTPDRDDLFAVARAGLLRGSEAWAGIASVEAARRGTTETGK